MSDKGRLVVVAYLIAGLVILTTIRVENHISVEADRIISECPND